MNITDIDLRFIEGQRPIVVIKFDEPVLTADVRWAVALEDEYKVNVYRGECGDYVRCGVESPPPKNKTEFPQHRYKMMDGTTRIARALMPTNEVAVNALFRMLPPVMECIIDDPEQGGIKGHVLVDSVAKYLWAKYSPATEAYKDPTITFANPEAPAMACIEWESGVRVYEPVICTWDYGDQQWKAAVNRTDTKDKIVFVATPGDPLTPILVALQQLKAAPDA